MAQLGRLAQPKVAIFFTRYKTGNWAGAYLLQMPLCKTDPALHV